MQKETGIEEVSALQMRHFTEKQNLTTLELADRYLERRLRPLSIAGDRAAFPNERFMPILKRLLSL